MENLAIFLVGRGITLGFSAAVLPGPFQGYLINTTLAYGWRRALYVVVSPLIVDIPIILAVLLALTTIESVLPNIVDIMQIIGGVFVLYLAWGALQDFRNNETLDANKSEASQRVTRRGTFTRAMVMGALSPGPYLFWTTVNGPLLRQALDQSISHGITFLIAFYGTFLSLLVALSVGINALRSLNENFTRWLILIAAVLLGGMGVWLIASGVQTLSRF